MAKKSKKTDTLPETQQRGDLFAQMTLEAQKLVKILQKKFAIGSQGLIKIGYDIGELIKSALGNEAKYGKSVVEQFSEYLGRNADELYALKNMVTAYSRAEVEAMIVKPMSRGGLISMGHMIALGNVRTAGERKRLESRIFSESLSVNELCIEIQAGGQGRKPGNVGAGAPPSSPSSPRAGVQQMISMMQTINKRVDIWQESVFDVIDGVKQDDEDINKVLFEKLQDANVQATKLEENLQQIRDRIVKNHERVGAVLRARESDAKAAEASAVAAGKPEGNKSDK